MSKLETALAPRNEISPFEKLKFQLAKFRPDIAGFVGDKNVDRFVRVILNAAQANPNVIAADRRSFFVACTKAAQDGLLPDGREAVFNIYRTKVKKNGREDWIEAVQYLPMSYGLIQKMYEAGATYVDAVPVYEKDDFDYQRGDEPKIVHKPYAGTEDPGEVKAAYVVVKLKTGEVKREVMWRREIDRVREKSKAKDGLMWKEFYDQAAVKSVIHRVVKQLPRAAALEIALAHDNEATGITGVTEVIDVGGQDIEALVDMRMPVPEEKKPEPSGGQGTAGTAAGTDTTTGGNRTEPPQEKKPAPKPGDAGSKEMEETFTKRLKECTDPDALDIIMDDVRFFTWQGDSLEDMTKVYQERRAKIREPKK